MIILFICHIHIVIISETVLNIFLHYDQVWNHLSRDCLITLQHCEPGGHISRLDVGSPRRVHTISFSPDGALLLSGGDDRVCRLWSTETWQQVARLEGHSSAITCASFLYRSWWRFQGGREDSEGLSPRGFIKDEVFGVRVTSRSFAASAGSPCQQDQRGQRRWREDLGGQEAPWLSRAGQRDQRLVATSSEDRTVRIFDLDEGGGACIAELRDHRDRVW